MELSIERLYIIIAQEAAKFPEVKSLRNKKIALTLGHSWMCVRQVSSKETLKSHIRPVLNELAQLGSDLLLPIYYDRSLKVEVAITSGRSKK